MGWPRRVLAAGRGSLWWWRVFSKPLNHRGHRGATEEMKVPQLARYEEHTRIWREIVRGSAPDGKCRVVSSMEESAEGGRCRRCHKEARSPNGEIPWGNGVYWRDCLGWQ